MKQTPNSYAKGDAGVLRKPHSAGAMLAKVTSAAGKGDRKPLKLPRRPGQR